MKSSESIKITVVTGSLPTEVNEADVLHINSFVNLLIGISSQIYLISFNFPKDALIHDKINLIAPNILFNKNNMILRIFSFFMMQIKISYEIIRIHKNVNTIIFSVGAVELVIPILISKLLNKQILLMHPGKDVIKTFVSSAYNSNRFGKVYIFIALLLEKLSYFLSDKIIVHTKDFNKYATRLTKHKLVYGSRFYVDSNIFKIQTKLSNRDVLVGYIGKFTDIKGIMKFVESIPLTNNLNKNVNFLICGDGPQKGLIKETIHDLGLNEKVVFKGWIKHDNLSDYLNRIKILVIPSETEVGPQILLEAMACGAIVLSTRVGIADQIIKHGQNGFILENNSPEHIAKNICGILLNNNLSNISQNARNCVMRNYSLDAVSELYKEIISDNNG
jgi:glycosyltransferase involved in cell wall biosynthesis